MKSRIRDPYVRFCGQSEASASSDPIVFTLSGPRQANNTLTSYKDIRTGPRQAYALKRGSVFNPPYDDHY